MSYNAVLPSESQQLRRGHSWLRVLLIGLCLFALTTIMLFWTRNPNMYPTVILIGNFLVPIAFVAFLYDHRHFSALTPWTIATSFCIGGVLGVLGASFLEALVFRSPIDPSKGLSITNALLIGFIEEGCKIVAVMLVARRIPHTSQMDGLLLGGAVGMGFAALESTGYAFTVFLVSGGHVSSSIILTIIRGLLAPFGHGVWTAILGAALFRASGPRHFRITIPVILTYIVVSLLHGLWDGLPHTIYFIIPPGIPFSVVTVSLSVIGLVLLAILYRHSISQQRAQQLFSHPQPQ